MATHACSLAWKILGFSSMKIPCQRSLVGYSCKELDTARLPSPLVIPHGIHWQTKNRVKRSDSSTLLSICSSMLRRFPAWDLTLLRTQSREHTTCYIPPGWGHQGWRSWVDRCIAEGSRVWTLQVSPEPLRHFLGNRHLLSPISASPQTRHRHRANHGANFDSVTT